MRSELRKDEQIVKKGPANLQKNVEAVGGWLYLTNERLVFEAHRLNVQCGVTEIDLCDIESSRKCWTKFLGFIPVSPNSLAVSTRRRGEYRFVVLHRDSWINAIEMQKNREDT